MGLQIGLSIAAIIQVIQMFALIIVQQNRTILEQSGSVISFLYISAQYVFSNWIPFSAVLIVLSSIGGVMTILRASSKKKRTLVTAILLLINLFFIGQWYDSRMAADHLLYLQNHIKSLIVFLFGITILFLYVWGIKRIMKEKKDFDRMEQEIVEKTEEDASENTASESLKEKHPFLSAWKSYKRYYTKTRESKWNCYQQYREEKSKRVREARNELIRAKEDAIKARALRRIKKATRRQRKYTVKINRDRIAMGKKPMEMENLPAQINYDNLDAWDNGLWASIAAIVTLLILILFGVWVYQDDESWSWINEKGVWPNILELLHRIRIALRNGIENFIPSLDGMTEKANQLFDAIISALTGLGIIFLITVALISAYFAIYFLFRVIGYLFKNKIEDYKHIKQFGQAFKVFFFDTADDVMRLLLFIPDFLFHIEALMIGTDSIGKKIQERFNNHVRKGCNKNGGKGNGRT